MFAMHVLGIIFSVPMVGTNSLEMFAYLITELDLRESQKCKCRSPQRVITKICTEKKRLTTSNEQADYATEPTTFLQIWRAER